MTLDAQYRMYGYGTLTINGETVPFQNTVVKSGADITSWLLSGETAYVLRYMYIAFHNGTTPPSMSGGDPSTSVSIFHNLTAPNDILRAPILRPIDAESSAVGYMRNRLKLLCITNNMSGVKHGFVCAPANNSKIFMLGVVASPGSSYTDDILYAYSVLSTPISVVISGQVSIAWNITVTI